MNRFEHIAQVLKQQTSGFTLSEIAERIHMNAFEDDRNKISNALNNMLNKGHVQKSAVFNNNPARWSMTAQGRAYYSVLNTSNDDETDDQTQPAETDPVSPLSVDHQTQPVPSTGEEIHQADKAIDVLSFTDEPPIQQHKDIQAKQSQADQPIQADEVARAVVTFNNAKKNLDQAFSNMLSLIIDVASQQPDTIAIKNKSQALALLETLETNELYRVQHRATFARIRQAVELMEDAA